ncbi:hypothetical protein AMECASPLE_038223 [Ameca splendens]|uniref:DUF6729 domain-containing protein n=1 Tax=Ameca splendens TaxID=208324 RepID=A0ABV0XX31_9TELE
MQHVLVQVQQPILVRILCQQVVLFTTSLHHSLKEQRPFFLLLHYRLPNNNGQWRSRVQETHSSLRTLLGSHFCGLRPCQRRITSGFQQPYLEFVPKGNWNSRTISCCGIFPLSRLSFTTRPQHRPGFLPIPYCCGCHTGCGRFGSFVLTKPVSRPLSSGGLHRRVQQVLDIDRFYNLVTETLICSKCRRNYLSWNREILEQLDMAHRSEFRVILNRQYACDIRVIRLLRERGLGNGPVRLIGQLKENHSEEWMKRVARYTKECAAFISKSCLLPPTFEEPPKPVALPTYKWLSVVYRYTLQAGGYQG